MLNKLTLYWYDRLGRWTVVKLRIMTKYRVNNKIELINKTLNSIINYLYFRSLEADEHDVNNYKYIDRV